jgi:hemerythrin-like domain-containing protein
VNLPPSAPVPGFSAPAAGFEAPFDLLQACHEKVLRMSDLLERLVAHVEARGADANARSAAADVLRYFDLAAPKHHEDEELHVFPALLAQDDARQCEAVAQLQEEHRRFERDWARLRTVLQAWRTGAASPIAREEVRRLAAEFAAMNRGHVELEETLTYPAARSLLDAQTLARMGAEMQARRRG